MYHRKYHLIEYVQQTQVQIMKTSCLLVLDVNQIRTHQQDTDRMIRRFQGFEMKGIS